MTNISKLYCGKSGRSDGLRYETGRPHKPVVVYNCTPWCNLNCRHCYSFSAAKTKASELSTAQAKKLLADLADYGCPAVLFSGGEPLLRDDVFKLIKEAARLGLNPVLSTNGTLIDKKIAKKLADTGISYVGVSVDGEENFHNRFRGTDGCFKLAVDALENCRDAGLKTGLRFTMTRKNKSQIPAVFEIAARFGVRRICFYHLIKAGRAKELDIQALDAKQARLAVDLIIDKTKKFVDRNLVDEVLTVGNHVDGVYVLMKLITDDNPLAEQTRNLLLAAGGNKVGEHIAAVNWDGSVFADQFWRNHSLGNVTKKSFPQIWGNDAEPVLKMLRDKLQFADSRCKICKWFELCRGNFRFSGADTDIKNWLNEPPCYLTDAEITVSSKRELLNVFSANSLKTASQK